MKTEKTVYKSSHQIQQILRAKYAAPEYAYFAEVANSTGSASRRADGLAMGLWHSRGLYLTGFEIKVSRSDWLNELKNPAKADLIAKYCDFWYVVVGDESIVKDGELPANWGLMIPMKGNLKIKVQAPKLEALPLSRSFFASLCRRACESSIDQRIINEAVSKARKEEYERGRSDGERSVSYKLPRLETENESLKNVINLFNEASGVNIFENAWDGTRPKKIGEAVKFLLNGGSQSLLNELNQIEIKAAKILETISVLKNLDNQNES